MTDKVETYQIYYRKDEISAKDKCVGFQIRNILGLDVVYYKVNNVEFYKQEEILAYISQMCAVENCFVAYKGGRIEYDLLHKIYVNL